MTGTFPSGVQQLLLVLLRTAIGWHLAYEGYVKLLHPSWSRAGDPLPAFSSAAYLEAARGPLAGIFHAMARPEWLPWIDRGVAIALLAAGLLLMLGLLTQLSGTIAMALLATFYLSAIPLSGTAERGQEGTYLIVNKTLVELIAVATLVAFRTGRIAGLDLLLRRRRATSHVSPAAAQRS